MYNDCIELLAAVNDTDEYGDTVEKVTARTVFAEAKSIGYKEKYEALGIGLNPEFKFVLADYYDYQGEELIRYNGTEYRVIRTYRTGTAIELVVGKSNANTKDSDESKP